jgi:RNA polymerase sigma factor FliA
MNHYITRYADQHRRKKARAPVDEREAIAREHATLVKQIAGRIVSRLPGHYEIEDLYSAGLLGLLTAIDNYDDSRGIPFDRYARIRIEGAILDALRESDHLPRTRRQRAKRIEAARRDLEKQYGRPVDDSELANAAGESVETVQAALIDAVGPTFLAPGDLARLAPPSEHPDDDPFARLLTLETRVALAEAIDALPERLRLLMSFYYREELTYKQIATILGVSESRVCHLHADAVRRLRSTIASL